MSEATKEEGRVLIMMGVCGCGKSLIGETVAGKIGVPFFDGDDFHPPENIEKMSRGEPLDDADRWPWLQVLHDQIVAGGDGAVLACSALRRSYRDALRGDRDRVTFVYLKGGGELISARMAARQGHYMKEGMVESQFAALEEPAADEGALVVEIDATPEEIVAELLAKL